MKPYGLIIAGGKSTRFGSAKHWAMVHGVPQWKHLWKELSQICEKVFLNISVEEFENNKHLYQIPLIIDRQLEGPLSGLNEAIQQNPEHDWLIVACDFFFADHDCFQEINLSQTSFFFSDQNEKSVPWLGKIIASDIPFLAQQYWEGERSLNKIIQKSQWATAKPSKWEWIQDIDQNAVITVPLNNNETDTLELFTFISGKEWLLRLLNLQPFLLQNEIQEMLNKETKSAIFSAISAKLGTLLQAMISENLIEIETELGQQKVRIKK